jgi:hypothetical protein
MHVNGTAARIAAAAIFLCGVSANRDCPPTSKSPTSSRVAPRQPYDEHDFGYVRDCESVEDWCFVPLYCNDSGRRRKPKHSMARVYADVNQNMPRSYWDYDSVNIGMSSALILGPCTHLLTIW